MNLPSLTGILDDKIVEGPQPCWDLVTRICLDHLSFLICIHVRKIVSRNFNDT